MPSSPNILQVIELDNSDQASILWYVTERLRDGKLFGSRIAQEAPVEQPRIWVTPMDMDMDEWDASMVVLRRQLHNFFFMQTDTAWLFL